MSPGKQQTSTDGCPPSSPVAGPSRQARKRPADQDVIDLTSDGEELSVREGKRPRVVIDLLSDAPSRGTVLQGNGAGGLRSWQSQVMIPDFVRDPSSPFCDTCQQIDLEIKFFEAADGYRDILHGRRTVSKDIYKARDRDGTYFYHDAILAHRFGETLTQPSDCPLCTFFRDLRVQPDRHKRHKLLAFRSSESWLFRSGWLEATKEQNLDLHEIYQDTVFMAVVPDPDAIPPCGYAEDWLDVDIPATGAIFLLRPGLEAAEGADLQIMRGGEVAARPDLKRARKWLQMCQMDHGQGCQRRASDEPITRGFRLIDCHQEPPVIEDKAWGTPYVALSYVWGTTPADLVDWPPTVLDAVQVAKDMGLRYLWVDRLCINQADMDEKAYLISRMTTIYEAAELTIVSAAGEGASYGLPGVGTRPRKEQSKFFLNSGNMLVSMLRDPRRDILESTYYTRGWTYQEGVLSNRRLVFTDDQTYWECRGMALQESIDVAIFHVKATEEPDCTEWVMADQFLGGIFKGAAHSGSRADHDDSLVAEDTDGYVRDYGFPTRQEVTVRAQLRGLNEHVREFSRRQLSRDTDTLLALQGIFGLYKQTKQLYLLHGLPMWMVPLANGFSGAQHTFALSVSTWYHRTGAKQFQYITEASRRKPHLPSWTWAGWDGVVSWRAPPMQEHCAFMGDLIKARSLRLLWAADMALLNSNGTRPNRLREMWSPERLSRESPMLLEIREPFLLNQFRRVPEIGKEWAWPKPTGRAGREQQTKQKRSWDAKWYRIGRRLSMVGMSIEMSEADWTAKHISGELVSVLVFAAKYLVNEHGTARFLTVRRIPGSQPERWERVGTLYLTIPYNDGCRDVQDFLWKIPAGKKTGRTFIIA